MPAVCHPVWKQTVLVENYDSTAWNHHPWILSTLYTGCGTGHSGHKDVTCGVEAEEVAWEMLSNVHVFLKMPFSCSPSIAF